MKTVNILDTHFKIIPFGNRASILKPIDPLNHIELPFIGQALLQANINGINEVIATDHDISLLYEGDVFREIAKTKITIQKTDQVKTFEIPICFEKGNDFIAACKATNLDSVKFKSQILSLEPELAMYGFLPGFLYFNGLPNSLHFPRKNNPEIKVAAGSIGIGGKYLGMYGIESPGGWNIIARTPLKIKMSHIKDLFPIKSSFVFKEIKTSTFETIKEQSLSIQEFNQHS